MMTRGRETLLAVTANVFRIVLAVVFIVSGFVKAIDPLGTQYKLTDYLEALGLGTLAADWFTLSAAVLLAATEFSLGVLLLFAIQRRLASRLIVALLLIMTPLTLWLAVANPISDCGCFGDAIHLTNWQTFWKNVVLLVMAIIVAALPRAMFRFVSESNQWIVINYTLLFSLAVSLWCLYDLPLFDFRPYHIGVNLREATTIPEGAEQPQFVTTFTLERDGERREFTIDDYPDSTWTFIDSHTRQISEGYRPPISDFALSDADDDDVTEAVLSDTSYVFLLVAPHLETADDSRSDLINEVYEYAADHDYRFYCLTASGNEAVQRWADNTGAEYPVLRADDVVLKTVIRSNPGLLLLHDATVIHKWSHNGLPHISEQQTQLPLHATELGQLPDDSAGRTLLAIILWFVLPLTLLTIADRLWMWTRWVRRGNRNENDGFDDLTINENENEKDNDKN